MYRNISILHQVTEWPPSFLEGVGPVPGGPSRRSSDWAESHASSLLNASSTAVDNDDFSRSQPENATIKEEPVDDDRDATVQTIETNLDSQETIDDDEIGLDLPAEEDEFPDYSQSYLDSFHRHFAEFNRPGRSSSDLSRRQREYEGPTRERRSPTRDRSRSPHTPGRSSSLFFPETPRRRERSKSWLSSTSSSTASPTPRTPKTPRKPRNRTLDEIGKECTCPISYHCLHCQGSLLDCRPLVLERGLAWEERDQEDYESRRSVRAGGEKFVESHTLTSTMNYVNAFETATSSNQRRQAIKHMESWVLQMEDVTLRSEEQQDLATTQVVPCLAKFLALRNRTARKQGKLPDYIEEEMTVLQRKWARGDFSGAIKRGLTARQVFDSNGILRRITYELDKTWEHHKSGTYLGEGSLVNGQIWMSRLELCRDGVHAPIQAGIGGTAKKGARSVVLGKYDGANEKGYANIDMGEVIEYMGTALPEEDASHPPTNVEDPHMANTASWNPFRSLTASTQAMMKSFETGRPIRVIRSAKMASIVPNKPRMGYRYDGLYKVVGMTPMKEARQIWSFRLQRLPEQGRLRGFRKDEPQPDASARRRGHSYNGR